MINVRSTALMFNASGLNSSDMCVMSAQAEVQINTSLAALTDSGPSEEFATGKMCAHVKIACRINKKLQQIIIL